MESDQSPHWQNREQPGLTAFTSEYDLGLIFTNAYRLLKNGFSRYAMVFVSLQLPLLAVQILAMPEIPDPMRSDPGVFLRFFLTSAFLGFLGLLVTLNIVSIAADQIANVSRHFHQRFAYSVAKFPIAVFASIVFGVVTFAGIIALIIPGIIFAVYASLFLQVIVLREKGIVSSLVDSYELIRGNWWRVFGTELLFIVAFLVVLIPLNIMEVVFHFGIPFQLIAGGISCALALYGCLVSTMIVSNLEALKKPVTQAPFDVGL